MVLGRTLNKRLSSEENVAKSFKRDGQRIKNQGKSESEVMVPK
jgi:hypothetical protein